MRGEMTLKNHIGLFVIAVMICYLVHFINYEKNKEFGLFTPLGAAVVLFGMIEIMIWTILFFFL